MGDSMESRALLDSPGVQAMPETLVDSSSTDNEWSDGSSSCSSYYSDSESSEAEWESLVDPKGDLLYIECNPNVPVKQINTDIAAEARSTFHRMSTRRSTRGKLSKLMRRNNSKNYHKAENKLTLPNSKVKFQEGGEGEIKCITLIVDPSNRLKLGRRASVSEALLGITTTTFNDGNRIMVAGHVSDGRAVNQKNIKIGDWLKSINNVEVNTKNFDQILLDITTITEVLITLQKVGGEEIETVEPSCYVRSLTNVDKEEICNMTESLITLPICIMYLSTQNLNENENEIFYCFPSIDSEKESPMKYIKGAFITLIHLLNDIINSEPNTTTINYNNNIINITYTMRNNEALLIALPESHFSLLETKMITENFIRSIEFMYQNLPKCFNDSENWENLNKYFTLWFSRFVADGMCRTKRGPIFENGLGAPIYMPLPKEAQLRIDDALSELASADYSDWRDEPLETRRKFTIIGSALFHEAALLGAQTLSGDLHDIQAFLNLLGLLEITTRESLKNLVLWREVFPSSCNRCLQTSEAGVSNKRVLQRRCFLLIVGRGKELLCVIVETRGPPGKMDAIISPDPFYVEEAQATLNHIQTGGIGFLAAQWLQAWRRPETIASTHQDLDLNQSSRNKEIISILKRRYNVQEHSDILQGLPPGAGHKYASSNLTTSSFNPSLSSNSVLSQSFSNSNLSKEGEGSEDSGSQMGHQERKQQRRDSESDGEWDGYQGDSQHSGCDDSIIKQNLLQNIGGIIPSKITSGVKNVLMHYIHLEQGEGVLITPLDSPQIPLLHRFRWGCLAIHAVLQNTLRFRKLLSQELTRPEMHRSLVAIREHGILIGSISNTADKANQDRYWIIGRLFSSPSREVYVCHHDSAPQNMVELAFRMALGAAG